MERKFRAREVGKSEYTSRGCTVFVEIQENDVAIVIDNFRMEFAPHFTTAGCVLFCVMYAKLEKIHVTSELALSRELQLF